MTRDLDLTPINDIMSWTVQSFVCIAHPLTRSHSHLIPLRIVSLHVICRQKCFRKMPSTNWRVPYRSWRFGKPLQSPVSPPCYPRIIHKKVSDAHIRDYHLPSTRGFIYSRRFPGPETHSPKWSTMKSQIRMVHWPKLLSPFIEAFCRSLFSRNSAGFSRNLLQV